jgi:hypothetical protein
VRHCYGGHCFQTLLCRLLVSHSVFSSVNKHSSGPVLKNKQPPLTSAFALTASSRQSISTARGLRHLEVCPVRRHGGVRNQRPWAQEVGVGRRREQAGGGGGRGVEEMNLCAWQWGRGDRGSGGRVWVMNGDGGGRRRDEVCGAALGL